jgi:hypothetical protein
MTLLQEQTVWTLSHFLFGLTYALVASLIFLFVVLIFFKLLPPPSNSVQIQISLRHGLTGLTKVFIQEYSDISQIRDGKFTYGSKFGVMT